MFKSALVFVLVFEIIFCHDYEVSDEESEPEVNNIILANGKMVDENFFEGKI